MLLGTDGGYKDELWMYDETLDYWFPKAAFPGGARRSAGAFSISGKGYAGVGKGLTGTRRDFWEYLPSIPLGIDKYSNIVFSNVYPNPMTDESTIILSDKISLQNLQNKKITLNVTGKALTEVIKPSMSSALILAFKSAFSAA